ncbi:hypothetical protein EKO27_g6536 [Xylaria grammica]|uniref:Uncharacterized protein n=1 Tax=Xylaria grammica TaxID=363999 RepID=A0A439D2C1_9PEZI|nr:hypothetical protein EKO27_g6536 [Xylaria grammica]
MEGANYHTFNIQLPLGVHIVTPMATSSSLLDRFSLLIATALGALQQSAQRKEIERAVTSEPLSEVQPFELDLALRELALETAQTITKDFVERLTKKLSPELPALPSPPAEPEPEPEPESVEESVAEEPPVEEPPIKEPPVKEPAVEVFVPEPEPPNPATQPPSAYQEGQDVTNPDLAAVLAALKKCGTGYNFAKVAGGFRCGGGTHFVSDNEAQAAYQKRVGVR